MFLDLFQVVDSTSRSRASFNINSITIYIVKEIVGKRVGAGLGYRGFVNNCECFLSDGVKSWFRNEFVGAESVREGCFGSEKHHLYFPSERPLRP